MSKKIALIAGTRPEVIKLAPLYRELESQPECSPLLIASGQHETMAAQAFAAFGVRADVELNLMDKTQTPNSFLSKLLARLPEILQERQPELVVVQGDTSTALGAALAAFHMQIPVAHVEAGLRTGDLSSPFPEEMNRAAISRLTRYHFAPTKRAVENLRRENAPGEYFLVGNTAVDAVLWMKERLESQEITSQKSEELLLLSGNKKLLLVTGHRRENFNEPLQNLCKALREIRDRVEDVHIVYPVHLNPKVQDVVHELLGEQERITLCPPLDYPAMVQLLRNSALIITDSGGIQEEAPSLGKKVLVTRTCTEREEAIEAGTAILCPLDRPELLIEHALRELRETPTRSEQSNPFGSGNTSKQIVDILKKNL